MREFIIKTLEFLIWSIDRFLEAIGFPIADLDNEFLQDSEEDEIEERRRYK
jgi:hypothetical protein